MPNLIELGFFYKNWFNFILKIPQKWQNTKKSITLKPGMKPKTSIQLSF